MKHLITGQIIAPALLQRAKEMRRDMTPAEKRLWAALRRNQLDGCHFRRQQIIGHFIVDFYCDAARLVIEVDGAVHDQQIEYDQERTRVLGEYDLRILRFRNEEIMDNLEGALARIRAALRPNPPAPFLPREGGISHPLAGEGPGVGS